MSLGVARLNETIGAIYTQKKAFRSAMERYKMALKIKKKCYSDNLHPEIDKTNKAIENLLKKVVSQRENTKVKMNEKKEKVQLPENLFHKILLEKQKKSK